MQTYISALATALTRRAVQIVLAGGGTVRPLGRLAQHHAFVEPGTVLGAVWEVRRRPQDAATLLIARCALPARAALSTVTAISIVLDFVLRAVRAVAGALLLGVAFAVGGATHCVCRCKLAVAAAVLVAVVAHSVLLELARLGVAAGVVAAACLATTIALFIALDYAVAASLAHDSLDIAVVRQTGALDAVSPQSGTDVTHAAGGKLVVASRGRRVHDETAASIACPGVERTTSLRPDDILSLTESVVAVVHSAKCVSRFVGDNLPLLVGRDAGDEVGSSDQLVLVAVVGLGTCGTGLSQPGEANGRVSVALAEQGPVAVAIVLLSAPLRKAAQALRNIEVGDVAGLIPSRGLLGTSRARGIRDDEVGEAQGDAELRLEYVGCGVDLLDDVRTRGILVSEICSVVAIRGDANQGDLARLRAPLGTSNGTDEVHACAVATAGVVYLALREGREGGEWREPALVVVGNRLRRVAHACEDWMIGVAVEVHIIAQTGPRVAAALPELIVLFIGREVRVAVGYHVIFVAQPNLGVLRVARSLVVARQLYMVVLPVQREGALKQRLPPIALYRHARPTSLVPTIPALHPCRSSVYSMRKRIDGLLPLDLAIHVHIRDFGSLNKDIVIRFEL